MASIGFLIGGALINSLAFSGSNFLFSSLNKESIDKERKRHVIKQHKAEKRFSDLNTAMQQYFLVTGRQLEPLPPKPVLSDFYVTSEDHHNRELAFITLSMIGIGAFLWYYEK